MIGVGDDRRRGQEKATRRRTELFRIEAYDDDVNVQRSRIGGHV